MTATTAPTAPPNVYAPPTTLAAFLREARTRAQVTQAAVAKAANMPLADWQRLEQGQAVPLPWTDAVVLAIARVLTADKDELLRLALAYAADATPVLIRAKADADAAAAAARTQRLAEAAREGLIPGAVQIKIRPEGQAHWLFTDTIHEALETILGDVPKPQAHVAWRLSFGVFSVECAHTQALDEAVRSVSTGTRMRAIAIDGRFAGTAIETFEMERVVLTEEQCLTMGEFEGW